MEKEIRLSDGRTVLVRDMRADEDVFELSSFINELIEEGAFLTEDTPVPPEREGDWVRGKMKEVEEGRCMIWCVFLDGKRVGGGEIRRPKNAERNAASMGIALLKDVRGQGLGHRLMSMLIEEAKKQWQPAVIYLFRFDANEAAKNLYEKLGFVECGRIPNALSHGGKQMDKVFMVLK
ncbi:MAG: GNAT family N-acetyltransferase [Candidatus Diapherotrites archaeon]|nr:GNAT family N-acetyltransferase [Candidatus Diapherotrites archaeon]